MPLFTALPGRLSAAVFLLLLPLLGWGQSTTIVNYDFNSGTAYGTLTPALATNVTSVASSTEAFVTYAGAASGAAAPTANTSAGNALGMANSSGTNTRYFQFQLGGTTLNTCSSYKLYFQSQRSASGATAATVAYSTDGTAFTSIMPTYAPGNGSFTEASVDLSAITALNNKSSVYFRILVSGASSTGTYRIDNFEIQATTTSPVLVLSSATLAGFTYVAGNGPSTAQSVNLSGSNLTAGGGTITINGSTNYDVSSDNMSFGPSATLAYTGTSLAANTPVYVRLAAGRAATTFNTETISISGGGATNSITASGFVAPALTEVYVPQYALGSATTDGRVPYAFRVTFSGLKAGATYQYFTQAIPSAAPAIAGNAKGNSIFANQTGSFSLTTAPAFTSGNYASFTASAAGSYTGWFILETSGNAATFTAGAAIRPVVVLNDGNAGTAVVSVVPTASTVSLLAYGTGASNISGVYGLSAATAKNFVLTYDNTAGSGRPLYASFVEDDGVGEISSYAAFYTTSVNAKAGRYGLLTPNTNANGIQRIEQRALADGSLVCANTDADGLWPSGVNTTNPTTGGPTAALVIAATDAPLTAAGPVTASTTSGTVGDDITLTGSNFVQGGTTVSFNGTAATAITFTNGTSLTAKVPAGATTGPLTLTTTSSCGSVQSAGTFTVVTPTAPAITVTGSFSAFNTLAGAASAIQSISVSGSNLTATLVLTPPTGYEVSIDGGANYSTSAVSLTPAGGTVAATTAQLRLTGLTPTASLGTALLVRSTGAGNQDQAVSGTVVAEPTTAPTIVAATPTPTQVTLTLSGGNGSSYLVVVRPAASAAHTPTDGTTYTASTTYGTTGPGATTGTDNYVVFAATAVTMVVVTGLAPSTGYVADVYAYNGGTVAGFENYLPTAGSKAFTTQAPPAGALLLEEDFDYLAATVLTTSTTTADATTGWLATSGNGTNNVATATGNLTQAQYPQGLALSATPAGTSTLVSLPGSGQDIAKAYAVPAVLDKFYASAIVNVATARTGDYFLALYDNATAGSTYRGRVYVKAVTGGFNFGLSLASSTITYSPNVYDLNTNYLLVLKYETNGTATVTSDDQASLFVLANTATPTAEPGTAAIVSTDAAALATTSGLNAILLRQGSASAAPTLTVDGLRVATGWGAAVGRPVLSNPSIPLMAGSYYDLTLSLGAATDVVAIQALGSLGAVTLENKLTLTKGQLTTTATTPLRLLETASVTANGATINDSFVAGPVVRPTSGAVPGGLVFPVGMGTAYRPITLTSTAQENAVEYTATQTEGNAGQSLAAGSGLTRVSKVRYYTVSANPAPINYSGTITLSFGTDDLVNSPADASLVVAKRPDASSPWANIGHGSNTGSGSAGTLTSEVFTSFSQFALASTSASGANNPLPVELTGFAAERAPTGVRLTWSTASEKNSAGFEVQRSAPGAVDFTTIATIAAHGSSQTANAYAALDTRAPAGQLYYRLRQLDQGGTVAYSPVVAIAAASLVADQVQAYPNPTSGLLTLSIGIPGQEVRLFDLSGRQLRQLYLDNSRRVQLGDVPAGTYLLHLGAQALRIIKQ